MWLTRKKYLRDILGMTDAEVHIDKERIKLESVNEIFFDK